VKKKAIFYPLRITGEGGSDRTGRGRRRVGSRGGKKDGRGREYTILGPELYAKIQRKEIKPFLHWWKSIGDLQEEEN